MFFELAGHLAALHADIWSRCPAAIRDPHDLLAWI
jgi:hypothetical protein